MGTLVMPGQLMLARRAEDGATAGADSSAAKAGKDAQSSAAPINEYFEMLELKLNMALFLPQVLPTD
jgi:hypothetical protein